MESVQFVDYEDDGTDQIVSFALAYGEMEIRSLILLRTPKFEAMLGESARGVSVSLQDRAGDDDDDDFLEVVRFEANRVTIETQGSKYDLDVSRVDAAEMSQMKALIGRMNFDNRFKIEDV